MNDQMSRTISRRGFLGGSLAAGGVLLVGCGGGSPSGNGSGGGGQTLRTGIPSDVLPPAVQRFNPSNRPIRRTVFDVLLDRKADGTYVPSLASDWEFSADKKTLVLNLRDGVTWHSGRKLVPDDIVFSIETALKPKAGVQVATMLKRANGIKKSGKSQVTVSFDEPFVSYLDALAMVPIVDPKTYDQIEDGSKVIGTGPFVWKSWTPGSALKLTKNDSYWQEGKPHLGGIDYSVITESQAMLTSLRSERIDLADRMLARDAANLKEDSRFAMYESQGFDLYVGCNTAVKPLDDIRVRQAIAYCLDRDRIAEQAYKGFAEASSCPWSGKTPGTTKAQQNQYAYNIKKAKSLLSDAGAAGAEIALSVSPQDPTFGAVGQIVQYGLEQAGLKVKQVQFTAAEWPKVNQAHKFPGLWVSIIGLTVSGVVASLLAANPLNPQSNTSRFTPPKYQSLVEAVVDAQSDDVRADATTKLTDYMIEQAFHNTVVQASSVEAHVAEFSGVRLDSTLSLVLTDAKFA